MSELISIIVPIYNVEEYLDYCVDSLVKQTYKNIEILLIDDGSTDSSGMKADKWAEQDTRIKVFHKENGGLSDSRNFGVQKSSSEWVMFIDSDDFYEPFAVEYFVRIQKKYGADMVVSALKGTTNHQTISKVITDDDIDQAYTLSNERAIEEMLYSIGTGVSACGKLFNKSILKKFPYPKGVVYEDLATTYKQMFESSSIYVAPIKVYGYFKREGSIVNSKFDKRYLYAFEIIDSMYAFIEEKYPESQELRNAIDVRNVFVSMQIANSMLLARMSEDIKKIQNRIRSYKQVFLKNSKVSLKNKIKYLLFIYAPRMYNYLRVRSLK
ncbi:TPA: glycosyltransferase family 2 protein [Streptococcus suis]